MLLWRNSNVIVTFIYFILQHCNWDKMASKQKQAAVMVETTSVSKFRYTLKTMAAAGTAACLAEILTIPIDTSKVRLQVILNLDSFCIQIQVLLVIFIKLKKVFQWSVKTYNTAKHTLRIFHFLLQLLFVASVTKLEIYH